MDTYPLIKTVGLLYCTYNSIICYLENALLQNQMFGFIPVTAKLELLELINWIHVFSYFLKMFDFEGKMLHFSWMRVLWTDLCLIRRGVKRGSWGPHIPYPAFQVSTPGGSTRGQIAQKCSVLTKFGRKNPWPEHNALLGSKVMQASARVNQSSNCLGISNNHQIW